MSTDRPGVTAETPAPRGFRRRDVLAMGTVALAAPLLDRLAFDVMAGLGLAVGFVGVTGLVWGSVNLFQATRISIQNITEEAALIRKREAGQQHPVGQIAPPS